MSVRWRVPVSREDGVECLICGRVLRTLGKHLQVHGLNAKEYRRQFPGAPTIGPLFHAIVRDIVRDKIEDGRMVLPTRQSVCRKGHAMRGGNVYIAGDGGRACRRCIKDYGRLYSQRPEVKTRRRELVDREKEAERVREYKKKNPEKRRASDRKSYKKHREKRLVYFREYNEEHREARADYHRRYREENREAKREYMRQYRAKKKESA